MKAAAVATVTYCVMSLFLFGDIFKPPFLLLSRADTLGAPMWPLMAGASTAVAALVFFVPMPTALKILRPAAFIALAMIGSILSVGLYAEHLKEQAVAKFGADKAFQNSFFTSLRNAPEEYQFYLHAGAIKDCVPYAWSYDKMAFYVVPKHAAINVLPPQWLTPCGITRGTP